MSLRLKNELSSDVLLYKKVVNFMEKKSRKIFCVKKWWKFVRTRAQWFEKWNFTFLSFTHRRKVKKNIAQSTANDCEKEKSNRKAKLHSELSEEWNVFTVRAKTIIRFSFHSESKHESESSERSVRNVQLLKVVRNEIESWRDVLSTRFGTRKCHFWQRRSWASQG